jgi:hypothetical protein
MVGSGRSSPLITSVHIHLLASPDTNEVVVEMTRPVIRSGDATMTTIEVAQERFVAVAYPTTMRAAQRAFKSWHERKRPDAIQECLAKMWDQWIRLVNRGRNPEPLLNGLIKYAILWVKYDRRLGGRARNIDVMDYRAGMKQQGIGSKGEVSPTDRSDKNNGWIDWAVSSRSEDPALLASALEQAGLTLEDWVGV